VGEGDSVGGGVGRGDEAAAPRVDQTLHASREMTKTTLNASASRIARWRRVRL
jgi:hypothetical protein